MLETSVEHAAALEARTIVPRDLLTITVRERSSGNPVVESFWSDIYDVTANVVDLSTGLPTSRVFQRSGTLIEIGPIQRASSLVVQEVEIKFLAVGGRAEELILTYDARQALVEIYRGFLNPDTRQLVAAAEPRFFGFVNDIQMPEGTESDPDTSVTLVCQSISQEMTRSNTSTRSDADQRMRHPDDEFFIDASTVGQWELFWGRHSS